MNVNNQVICVLCTLRCLLTSVNLAICMSCIQIHLSGRSQWPRGLRRRSAAARLLGFWVRIPPGAWMSVVNVVSCQVEVSTSGWSLVQRSPTECGVSEYDRESSIMRRPWPTGGCWRHDKKGSEHYPKMTKSDYKSSLKCLLFIKRLCYTTSNYEIANE
jgi:hypothetical protein